MQERLDDAIVRAKKLLLRSAQEDCYNVAIRLNRGTPEAREANRLANLAHDLFEKAAERKDIGESVGIYEDDYASSRKYLQIFTNNKVIYKYLY